MAPAGVQMCLGISSDLVEMPTEVFLQGAMETSGKAPVLSDKRARHDGMSQEQEEMFVLHVTWVCLLDTAPLPLWL